MGPDAGIDEQAHLAADLLHASQSLFSDPALLDAGIVLLTDAVRRIPRRHPRRRVCLFNLSQAYTARYDASENPADLQNAVKYGERVQAMCPPGARGRATILYHLSVVYRKRYELLGRRADLDQALSYGRDAVRDRRSGSASYVQSSLGTLYKLRYERTGDMEDLSRAIRHAEEAIAVTPEDDFHRPGLLHNLAFSYRARHECTGNFADLDRAIDLGEQINTSASLDHPVRLDNLSSLGLAWQARFEATSDITALDRAVEVGELAVAGAPEGTAVWARFVGNLIPSLMLRHRYQSARDDLCRAQYLAERLAPTTHRGSDVLSGFYLQRFITDGASANLDLAIDLETRAMTKHPKRSPGRPGHLANLSALYWLRYMRLGLLIDLVRSVEAAEQAVELTPVGHPDRARRLAGLMPSYCELFTRTDVPEQLTRAVAAGEQALADMPESYFDYGSLLLDLGRVHRQRYRRGGDASDIERAIELGYRALAVTPDSYSERAALLSDLASSYGTRHERDGNAADLDQAIELCEQSLAAMPEDHWQRASALANLSLAYQTRCAADPAGFDLARLRDLVRATYELTAAAPPDRVRLCYTVGSLALVLGEDATAVSLLDDAVSLLPSVAPREGEWVDQEFRLGDYPGLIGAAISAHCANADPDGAVEVAEWGRGIMLASRLNLRADLTELARAEPEAARQLGRVRDQLNAIDPLGASPADLARRADQRRTLWTRHDALLTEVRRIPKFERFLLSPPLQEVRAAAAGGAVVLVNAHERRADAVIVTADADPLLVALPSLYYTDVLHRAGTLLETTHVADLTHTLRKQRIVPEMLAWLWDTIVEPVVNALQTQRVWWMPTGLLGLFPLHAAGHPGRPGALDAITSSYTVTARTLADARGRAAVSVRRQLTVALRHTPGLPDLPGTAAEADELQDQRRSLPPLRDGQATTANVLGALQKATWAHFACHASANPMHPAVGGLHLHDGMLTAPTIGQLRLSGAELAYLSACSTGNRGVRSEDESIHPASAFQLAGFRHVVASLWPLEDQIAATAARSFYRYVEQDQPAHALRRVALELRDMHPARPDLWAALIHTGP